MYQWLSELMMTNQERDHEVVVKKMVSVKQAKSVPRSIRETTETKTVSTSYCLYIYINLPFHPCTYQLFTASHKIREEMNYGCTLSVLLWGLLLTSTKENKESVFKGQAFCLLVVSGKKKLYCGC